jgi:hypothetical protein
MTLSPEERNHVALTLTEQARRCRASLGDLCPIAPVLERAARALGRGEALEVEGGRPAPALKPKAKRKGKPA